MARIDYHVFRKKKISNKKDNGKNKVFYRWYYYYTDASGKRIQRACPKCKNRTDAESYIRTLPPLPGADNPDLLVADIAKTMYIPGSDHVDRRRQLGKSTQIETLCESRVYVDYIIREWGDRNIKDVDPGSVVDYLFKIKKSGSWKNRYITIFKEIFLEAPRYGCKIQVPQFPRFALNTKKADVFTDAELSALFKPENFPDASFYLMFLLALSGGLRLGEARAVRWKQILFDKKILIVDGFCKRNGDRTVYNKKGTPEEPKLRAVWIPDLTLDLINAYAKNKAFAPDDFIFTFSGKPIRMELAEAVFVKALINAKIARSRDELAAAGVLVKGKIVKKSETIPGGRKLVPHSLRYTYVSRMRRELSAADMLPMTGHVTEAMVDYYSRQNLDDVIASLPRADAALKGLLNFAPAN